MKTSTLNLPQISLRYSPSAVKKAKISSSKDASLVFREIFDTDTIAIFESFNVLFTNRANLSIGWMLVSQGGVSGTVVDSRLILKAAIDCCACGVILCHNHPSGNLKPSQQDIDITKKIKEACKLLDIVLLDHIILAPMEGNSTVAEGSYRDAGGYYSFADDGLV